ncbi:sulfotransferase family 2 domain-containing protein [Bacteroidota bacterium]
MNNPLNSDLNYSYKIISHSRKFIWFEYPKTASSSIKTLIFPYLFREYCGFHPYFNYRIKYLLKSLLGKPSSRWPFGGLGDENWRKIMPDAHFTDDLYNSKYDQYYKFSIVRNPFDKMVSAYKHGVWGVVDPNTETFEEFIISILPRGKRELKDLSDRGRNHFIPWTTMFDINRTDLIIHFENLSYDMPLLLDRIGIKEIFPKENVSRISNEYRSYYNDFTREVVTELYHKDLKTFDYEF